RACPLIVLGVERVDVADTAAHKQENHGFGLGCPGQRHILEFAVLRPDRAECRAEESARGLRSESAPVDPAAGKQSRVVHRSYLTNRNSSMLKSSHARPFNRAGSFSRYVNARSNSLPRGGRATVRRYPSATADLRSPSDDLARRSASLLDAFSTSV